VKSEELRRGSNVVRTAIVFTISHSAANHSIANGYTQLGIFAFKI
jgi:hypothetical protein